MRLQEIGDPLACWQYAERYLGEGTRTYSRYAGDLDISPACHPRDGTASFRMPSFYIPRGQGELLTNSIPSELPGLYQDGDRLLLPVHPDALTCEGLVGRKELLRCDPGPWLEVVPSANARTVFVVAFDGVAIRPHFLKLHYPRRLSRFTRRLRKPVIDLQLWVADELAALGVAFLPEVAGGAFGIGEDAWGFVVREQAPSSRGQVGWTVPLFALYGKDLHAPDDVALLEQLVAASGESAETFVADRIVAPMVRLWTRVAMAVGCALELHGQNTLISFAPDGRGIDVLYRDCEVYVDPCIRLRQGLTRTLPPRM